MSLLKEVKGERSTTAATATTNTTTSSSSSSSRWSWCIRCRGGSRWGFCPSGYGAAHSCKAGLTGRSQGAGGASQQPLKGPGPQRICREAGSYHQNRWAARDNTWILIEVMPKGIVFSFLMYSYQTCHLAEALQHSLSSHLCTK